MTGAGMEVSKSKIAFFTNLITLREKFVVLSRGLSSPHLYYGTILSYLDIPGPSPEPAECSVLRKCLLNCTEYQPT